LDKSVDGFITFKPGASEEGRRIIEQERIIHMDAQANLHRDFKVRMSKRAALSAHVGTYMMDQADPKRDRTYGMRFFEEGDSIQAKHWIHVTKILPQLLIYGEKDAEVTKLLTDFVFLEEKCRCGHGFDLVNDFHLAATLREIGSAKGSPVELYAGLVRSNAHLLHHAPQRILFSAFNSPDNTVPAMDARKLFADVEGRSHRWDQGQFVERNVLKIIGKPQQRNPAVSTFELQSQVNCVASSGNWIAAGCGGHVRRTYQKSDPNYKGHFLPPKAAIHTKPGQPILPTERERERWERWDAFLDKLS